MTVQTHRPQIKHPVWCGAQYPLSELSPAEKDEEHHSLPWLLTAGETLAYNFTVSVQQMYELRGGELLDSSPPHIKLVMESHEVVDHAEGYLSAEEAKRLVQMLEQGIRMLALEARRGAALAVR